jgi:cysteinyl-tRNA synthetase
MSKSLGNSILVRDILETYDANSFRLLILSTPYRQNINFTNELMEQFEKEYQKIYKAYKQADLALQINDINNNCLFEEYLTQMNEFMNNDLNTGNVITLAYDLVKKINTYTRSKEYDLLSKSVNTLKVILNVLGIEIELKQLETSDKEIYANWENARKEKNFDLADKYRQELIQRGIL